MRRNRPPSAQAVKVLRTLAADPARWRKATALTGKVHLKSGSLYPILVLLTGCTLAAGVMMRQPGVALPGC